MHCWNVIRDQSDKEENVKNQNHSRKMVWKSKYVMGIENAKWKKRKKKKQYEMERIIAIKAQFN